MKYILLILTIIIFSTGIISCGSGEDPQQAGMNDIVIVGGDTLGRNWDNLPSKDEVAQAEALGLTPEQYMQLKAEEQNQMLQQNQDERQQLEAQEGYKSDGEGYELPSTSFSDQMYKDPTYTIETPDGREVVVGTKNQH